MTRREQSRALISRRNAPPTTETPTQQAAEQRKAFDREAERVAALKEKKSWSDNIIISQDTQVLCCAVLWCAVLCCGVLCCAVLCCAVLCYAVLCCAVMCCAVLILFPHAWCSTPGSPNPNPQPQAFIYKYVPIIGPIVGSAFVLGLYLLARLLRGDLTDRLKMMDSEVGSACIGGALGVHLGAVMLGCVHGVKAERPMFATSFISEEHSKPTQPQPAPNTIPLNPTTTPAGGEAPPHRAPGGPHRLFGGGGSRPRRARRRHGGSAQEDGGREQAAGGEV